MQTTVSEKKPIRVDHTSAPKISASFVIAALAIIFSTSLAKADKNPDEAEGLVPKIQALQIARTRLARVTAATDAVISYAANPHATIEKLNAVLVAEQKAVGVAMQTTRAKIERENNATVKASMQHSLGLLQAQYSEIFNEIMDLTKGRLPPSLIGRTEADVRALFSERARLEKDIPLQEEALERASRSARFGLTCPLVFR